jgi:Zn-dependent peptidase ImmA (M78 family)
MKDNSTRQIALLAKRFLLKHGVVAPPVPLELLLKKTGVDLRVGSFKEAFFGFYLRKQGGLRADLICINTANPRNVQRLALAHEMSHMLLANQKIHVDWPDSSNRRDTKEAKDSDPEEILADLLALELLLPRHILSTDIDQPLNPHDDESLNRLAARYEVSVYALIFRLEQVGLLQPEMKFRKALQNVSPSLSGRRTSRTLPSLR